MWAWPTLIALLVATAALSAVEKVGLPEARIILAHATIYIATAPKSNSVIRAIDAAMDDVKTVSVSGVPLHLRDSSYRGASTFGHGAGYRYPHDYPGAWVEQRYMPERTGREAVLRAGAESHREAHLAAHVRDEERARQSRLTLHVNLFERSIVLLVGGVVACWSAHAESRGNGLTGYA